MNMNLPNTHEFHIKYINMLQRNLQTLGDASQRTQVSLCYQSKLPFFLHLYSFRYQRSPKCMLYGYEDQKRDFESMQRDDRYSTNFVLSTRTDIWMVRRRWVWYVLDYQVLYHTHEYIDI